MKKIILTALLIFGLSYSAYSQCNGSINESGQITVTTFTDGSGQIGVKIAATDIDSLETDSSVCFSAAIFQKLISSWVKGYDTISLNNMNPIYYAIQTPDSINAYLLGKMFDEPFTVIDTFATAKGSTFAEYEFSIVGNLTGRICRFPFWGVRIYGFDGNNTSVTIYIWSNTVNRPGGGGHSGSKRSSYEISPSIIFNN